SRRQDMKTDLGMGLDLDLDPSQDDLPLKANTNHMLVKHYVLDLTVHFEKKVFEGSVFLFLETGKGAGEFCDGDSGTAGKSHVMPVIDLGVSKVPIAEQSASDASDTACGGSHRQLTSDCAGCHGDGLTENSWENESSGDFILVLDCCDLAVTRVEEVDVTLVPGMEAFRVKDEGGVSSACPSAPLLQGLMSLPAACWEQQHSLYYHCSRAPTPSGAGTLLFHTDKWSLQIRKKGVRTPHNFPRSLRIWYETKPEGSSVRWTKDQSGRLCVYTVGCPINNRALFPCQEPPVAMSTWQARVQAPSDCVVLLSGENEADPVPQENGTECTLLNQFLCEADNSILTSNVPNKGSEMDYFCLNLHPCSHVDFPCRFPSAAAQAQAVIPYRVFAPSCLLQRAEDMLLPLLSPCLAAAFSFLGVHPFSRLDVLIVPAEFPSLGMA
ncbi:hypothetical protein Z043_104197, partial [Scleropages formosus]